MKYLKLIYSISWQKVSKLTCKLIIAYYIDNMNEDILK